VALSTLAVSEDGRLVAYGTSASGSDRSGGGAGPLAGPTQPGALSGNCL